MKNTTYFAFSVLAELLVDPAIFYSYTNLKESSDVANLKKVPGETAYSQYVSTKKPHIQIEEERDDEN